MQAPPLPADLDRASRAAYLLTLWWGGRVVRVATEPLGITDDTTGQPLQYQGGLTEIPAVDDLDDAAGVSDAGPSVPMALYLDGLDIAEELAAGRGLDGARGELAEIHLDANGDAIQAWSRRIVHVRQGRLLLPVVATTENSDSYASFTLEETPRTLTTTLLDPRAVIDATTWPSAVDAEGKVYPVVIGRPGVFRRADGTSGSTSGSPGYPVTYSGSAVAYLLICDGRVAATSVTVYDSSGGSASRTPFTTLDGRGRQVTVVELTGSGLTLTDATFYVGWTGGGGILNPLGTAALTTLADVLVWAALRMGGGADIPAWQARRGGVLEVLEVDTYVNDPEQTPLEFVTELLEPLETVRVRLGVDGLYPQVRRLDASLDAAAVRITEGGDFSATSPLESQIEPGDVCNAVTVRFAPRANGGAFKRALTCTPDPAVGDTTQFPTEYAVASASRYGRSQAETVEVSWLTSEVGAARIASDLVRLRGLPYATRTYRADWRYGWIEVGQRLRLTDERLHLTDHLVEVAGKAPRIGGYDFLIRFTDDPQRRT